jgi:predicted nucleic acid-binding Zn ribbon protein
MASQQPSTRKSAARQRGPRKTIPASQPPLDPLPTPSPDSSVRPVKTARRENPQARRQTLAQWRRIDMAPLEQAASLRVRALNQLVPHVLKGLGLDQRRANAEILRVWQQSIDPTVTAHAHPTGLRRGTLFVAVDSNVWLSEIVRYRYAEILQRLQHSFGTDLITRISFRAQ